MIALLALVAACGGSGKPGADTGTNSANGGPLPVEAFAEEYAREVCAWYEACGVLVDVYETWEGCLTHYEDAMNTYVGQAACDYDPDLGRACVDEVSTVECDEAGYHWADDSPCLSMCGE